LRWVICATGGFILLIAFFVATSHSLKQNRNTKTTLASARHRLFQNPADIPDSVIRSLDAVFVLGGGAPLSLDQPPVYTQRRCDDAARVLERTPAPLPILCLSAGTAHVPQLLSPTGLPIWESTSSAAYLQAKYPSTRNNIYVETTSYDTIGNAFYARTSHSDIAGWKKILIVTNEVRNRLEGGMRMNGACARVSRMIALIHEMFCNVLVIAVSYGPNRGDL
jgi:uncharacterized SAM-binding protein YcdF (DUF218 family)